MPTILMRALSSAFAILPAKNSRNRAVAWGPASTITCGRTISAPPPVATGGSAAAGTRLPSSFRHHLSRAGSTTYERLEPPQVVPQRPGQRVEPRQGILRPAHRGRSASFALMASAGTLNRNPVSPAGWSSATRRARLSSSTRNAARPGPREGPLVAGELGPEGLHEGGGAHLAVNLSAGAVAGGGPFTLIPDPFRPARAADSPN